MPSLSVSVPYPVCMGPRGSVAEIPVAVLAGGRSVAILRVRPSSSVQVAMNGTASLSLRAGEALILPSIDALTLRSFSENVCTSLNVDLFPQFPFPPKTSVELLSSAFSFYGVNFVIVSILRTHSSAPSSPVSVSPSRRQRRDSCRGCLRTISAVTRRQRQSSRLPRQGLSSVNNFLLLHSKPHQAHQHDLAWLSIGACNSSHLPARTCWLSPYIRLGRSSDHWERCCLFDRHSAVAVLGRSRVPLKDESHHTSPVAAFQ